MEKVTLATYSIAFQGEKTQDELKALQRKIGLACKSEGDIYVPSAWLTRYEIKEMEIIPAEAA